MRLYHNAPHKGPWRRRNHCWNAVYPPIARRVECGLPSDRSEGRMRFALRSFGGWNALKHVSIAFWALFGHSRSNYQIFVTNCEFYWRQLGHLGSDQQTAQRLVYFLHGFCAPGTKHPKPNYRRFCRYRSTVKSGDSREQPFSLKSVRYPVGKR